MEVRTVLERKPQLFEVSGFGFLSYIHVAILTVHPSHGPRTVRLRAAQQPRLCKL